MRLNVLCQNIALRGTSVADVECKHGKGKFMSEETIEHLEESVELAGRMLDLAERGVGGCQDDGCLVVYGIIRDCAYKIRSSAQNELQEHHTRKLTQVSAERTPNRLATTKGDLA